jgi:hypothetical protein
MPTTSQFYYGIFFGDHCGGVAVFGPEQGENLGVWNRYGYGGKIIALQRGACLPWAHPHAASKLIRGSMRLLPEHIKVVTATVDPLAGEIGGIYQSCGFDYVGQMCNGGRALLRINGETMSERQAGRLFATSGARALAKLGFEAISVPRKGRYFAFRGTRAERKKLRAAITHLLTAYPKRGTDTRNAGAPAAGNA